MQCYALYTLLYTTPVVHFYIIYSTYYFCCYYNEFVYILYRWFLYIVFIHKSS